MLRIRIQAIKDSVQGNFSKIKSLVVGTYFLFSMVFAGSGSVSFTRIRTRNTAEKPEKTGGQEGNKRWQYRMKTK